MNTYQQTITEAGVTPKNTKKQLQETSKNTLTVTICLAFWPQCSRKLMLDPPSSIPPALHLSSMALKPCVGTLHQQLLERPAAPPRVQKPPANFLHKQLRLGSPCIRHCSPLHRGPRRPSPTASTDHHGQCRSEGAKESNSRLSVGPHVLNQVEQFWILDVGKPSATVLNIVDLYHISQNEPK